MTLKNNDKIGNLPIYSMSSNTKTKYSMRLKRYKSRKATESFDPIALLLLVRLKGVTNPLLSEHAPQI